MKKKSLTVLSAVMAAAMLLSGCSSSINSETADNRSDTSAAPAAAQSDGSDGPKEGSEIDDSEYTLKFWHISPGRYDTAIERFKEKYPNVTIEEITYDNDAYKTKIKTVMGAGAIDIPDVFLNWGGDGLKTYVENGLVMDITDLVADFKVEYYDYEFGLSTFDGSIYGMGAAIAPAGIFYNKEIFAELGLEVPTTWEELDSICAKLKEAGYTPFALGNKSKWPGLLEYTMLITDMGGQELSDALLSRNCSFENEVVVEAGSRIKNFLDKGYYPIGTNGIDNNAGGSRMLFYNDMAGMIILTNGFLGSCMSEDPEFYDKVGVFQYPSCSENSGGIVAGGHIMSISSQCKRPEIAAEFLHYITNAEFCKDFLEKENLFTGAKDVTIEDPLVKQQFDTLMSAEWLQNFYDQHFVYEVGEALKDATQAIYGGTMTPEEAAAYVEKIAEESYGPVK